MRARTRNFKKVSAPQEFWPSYTDVMTTVAMIIFFLMLLSYIQNVLTGRKLAFSVEELQDVQNTLTDTQLYLGETEARLATTEREIAQKEATLTQLEAEIEKTRTEVDTGRLLLAQSLTEISEQQHIILASAEELEQLRQKLSEIAVLRVDILEKVKNSIEEKLNTSEEPGRELVSIGPNANIIINEQLVFDYGSAEIKEEGKQLLTQLAFAFEDLLGDAEIRSYIDYINIEGHTDSSGGSEFNRNLSAERAAAVANFMMRENQTLEEQYARYFGITGFSKFRPLAEEVDDESMARNRRIEISIVVRDESISKVIDEYLEQSVDPFRVGTQPGAERNPAAGNVIDPLTRSLVGETDGEPVSQPVGEPAGQPGILRHP